MNLFRQKLLFAVICLAILLSGCGKVYSNKFYAPSEMRKGIKKIVVLPFNDLSGSEDASLIVTKLFAGEIQKRFGVEVIEGEDLVRQLSLNRIDLDDTASRLGAARIAQALSADAVLYGDVLEYRYRNWLSKTKSIMGDPVVCLGARLVNGETGTVVWAATDVKTEYNIFSGSTDPLSGMAEKVVRDLVKSMKLNAK